MAERLFHGARLLRWPNNAAETEMAGRRVDRLRHPRRGPIAPAIVRRTEIGSALGHAPRNRKVGHARVEAFLERAAARIVDGAARTRDVLVALIPVDRPLPDVARHVVEAIPVRR